MAPCICRFIISHILPLRAMSQRSATTVNITYQAPPRANLSRSSSRHERQLKGVPESVARQVLQDFAAYQASRDRAEQREVYTYQQRASEEASSEEVMVALDFGEICGLQVKEVEATTQIHEPVLA